jgi:membrane protein YqaA with SNARE-associated domain
MENLSLSGLFISAFISSTLAPGGSEAVLAYLVLHPTQWSVAELIATATVGNTLGALTTWFLGGLAAKKYPAEAVLSVKKQRAIDWVKKWGCWALLFSWLPIIGDGFCFAGGWLKLPLLPAVMAILLGKATRYWAVVSLLTLN